MIDLFPEGFEEVERDDDVELVAYTDPGGEERLWHAFGGVARAEHVPNGWEERWRDFHRPVRVGSLWIGPPWERPATDAIAVVVDPGRAFGTGAHPTTRLCLQLLQGAARGSLLDVGCGSGVLGIAAAKLGFAPVVAVDDDEQALAVAAANARANGVALELRLTDASTDDLPPADVAVANVTLAVVEAVGARVEAATFVASGYLAADRPELPRFDHVDRVIVDGWAADTYLRRA
jgi:ribosomal protein L11 methyltransferase